MLLNSRRRRRSIQAVLMVGIAIYCWFAAGLRPFTVTMDVAVAIPEVAVGFLAFTSRPGSQSSFRPSRRARVTWRGAIPWTMLLLLLAIWQLAAYLESPRRDHPTLSSLAGSLQDRHPGRATLMLAWLLLGWALFIRTRQPGSVASGS